MFNFAQWLKGASYNEEYDAERKCYVLKYNARGYNTELITNSSTVLEMFRKKEKHT